MRPASSLLMGGLLATSAATLVAGNEGAMRIAVLRPDGTPYAGIQVRATVAVASPTQINSAIVGRTNSQGVVYFYKLTPGMFTIQVDAEGFPAGAIRTDVKSDQMSHLKVVLRPRHSVEVAVEEVNDTLDVTSSTTGSVFKRSALDSLPIDRTMTSVLAATPGIVRIGNSTFEPSLVSSSVLDLRGLARIGTSTFMLDGIDVTSPYYGTSRVNIAPELISEIDLKTGGITAEYVARSGLFMNTTTINGGNSFFGGLTYAVSKPWSQAYTKPGLPGVSKSDNTDLQAFVAGPIVKDRLWYVVSVQKLKQTATAFLGEDVAHFPGETRDANLRMESNLFAKLTWNIAPEHRLISEYHYDGNTNDTGMELYTPTNRVTEYTRGGSRWLGWYSWQTPQFMLDVKVSSDLQRNSLGPGNKSSEPTVELFPAIYNAYTPSQSQFGPYPIIGTRDANVQQVRVDLAVPFTTGGVTHLLKVGGQSQDDEFRLKYDYNPQGYVLNVDAPTYVGDWYDWLFPAYYFDNIVNTINADPVRYARVRTTLNPGGGGVTVDHVLNSMFDEPYGGNAGKYGYMQERYMSTPHDVTKSHVKSKGFYIQEAATAGRFSVTLGCRFDRYRYEEKQGVTVADISAAVAPRLGFSYDVFGDAKTRLFGFYGTYYDRPRLDMLANSVNGVWSLEDQLRIAGEWITADHWTTGTGTVHAYANNLRLPKTVEMKLGCEQSFKTRTGNYVVYAAATWRKNTDILAEYIANLYLDPDRLEAQGRKYFKITGEYATLNPQEQKIINTFRGLAMTESAFANAIGMSAEDLAAVGGLVTMNAPGGERSYKLLDLSIRRDLQNHWGGDLSLTFLKASGTMLGNSEPDSFVGSQVFADPRLTYNHGTLDGTVKWLTKGHFFYRFDSGFRVGLVATCHSGSAYSESTPMFGGGYTVKATLETFDQESRGTYRNPVQVQADLHLEYLKKVKRVEFRVFADVFNVANRQTALLKAEGDHTRAGFRLGEGYMFQDPRRAVIGVSMTF